MEQTAPEPVGMFLSNGDATVLVGILNEVYGNKRKALFLALIDNNKEKERKVRKELKVLEKALEKLGYDIGKGDLLPEELSDEELVEELRTTPDLIRKELLIQEINKRFSILH